MRPDLSPRRLSAALLVLGLTSFMAACASTGSTPTPAASAAGASPSGSVAGSSSSAMASGAVASVTINTGDARSVGTVLTGTDGKTLYVFHKDSPGKSACSGGCATTWPPLTVASPSAATPGSGVTGTLGTISRDDGSLQVTYNGSPLYYYSGDNRSGMAAGQGIGGVWFAATPTGGSGASQSAPASSSPAASASASKGVTY